MAYTWDVAFNFGAGVVLSNNDKTLRSTSTNRLGGCAASADTHKSSGKWYWETSSPQSGGTIKMGIVQPLALPPLGQSTVFPDPPESHGVDTGTSQLILHKLDMAALVYSYSEDLGETYVDVAIADTTWAPAASVRLSNSFAITGFFELGEQTYAAPAGFTAFDGTGGAVPFGRWAVVIPPL